MAAKKNSSIGKERETWNKIINIGVLKSAFNDVTSKEALSAVVLPKGAASGLSEGIQSGTPKSIDKGRRKMSEQSLPSSFAVRETTKRTQGVAIGKA